jgi:hypothetical protein
LAHIVELGLYGINIGSTESSDKYSIYIVV